MAMNKTVLTNLIKANLTALGRDVSKIDVDGLGAIADAIVTHITGTGVVSLATPGLTALQDGSGPIATFHTGTATGTIT